MKPLTRMTALLAGLFMVVGLSLSACGQRGPLYMPDKDKQEQEKEKSTAPY